MIPPILAFETVSKTYDAGSGHARVALRDVSLAIEPGQVVALVGPSGSGKSTLLHLAAGIDVPTAGRVLLGGDNLAALGDRERTLRRRREVGIVFQFFHLLPHLDVLENVRLPRWIAGSSGSGDPDRARALLADMGLADRAGDPVDRLSGGEKQRVAICRALCLEPRLLLADEPTGNLDEPSGRTVLELLLGHARRGGGALLIATHSLEVAARADHVWRLRDGTLHRS